MDFWRKLNKKEGTMAENKTELRKLGDFFCTVSSNMQIFIPVRMCGALGIAANDEVKFSFQKDGSVLFSKDAAASKESHGQKEKDKKDGEKVKEALT